MFKEFRKEIEWGGRPLVFETGKIARQADGAVMVTYGETKVLCTAVGQKKARTDIDFFPLTVNYQEKAFAAGKIPGGFFKREGRPSEKETLTSRLIDRPIRPLFAPGYKNETQVICTVLAHDLENDPDIVAMVGASAALTISGMPFMGPIGAARVGYIEGEYVLNPTTEELEDSVLDLAVAGTQAGVLMVESEAQELSEEIMLGAVAYGHKEFQTVIDAIIDLAEACANEPWDMAEPVAYLGDVEAKAAELAEEGLRAAYKIKDKQERVAAVNEAKDKVTEFYADAVEAGEVNKVVVAGVLKNLEKDIVRRDIIATQSRIDGRDTKTVRAIDAQVGLLPRAHGSALFTRGETQAMAVTTLGTGQDEQIIDALDKEYRENFMLHYNFPPYSVGEASFLKSPGRREIGHGKLAWRAIRPLMPSKEEFPYTVRVVSEVTESNGSSSMATVCGTSLSLMDSGVPLKRPVAGIAMGLIKEDDGFAVLSDILGDEDHLGDMDFKVAGTCEGITSLQMDIKITSITPEIMEIALDQAKGGRQFILDEMASAITSGREDVSNNAPKITAFQINKDKIREVIGTGGKVIRQITEETGAKIDIEDDGTIRVAAVDGESGQKAIDWIQGIVAEPEINKIYRGKVVKVMDFGAFVNYMGTKDGLVHISELKNERVAQVSDVLSEGDEVWAKLIGIDDRGKVKLSMRVVDQETGNDITEEVGEKRPRSEGEGDSDRPRKPRGPRKPRRD
ncbi:polynucleotide phosphorylase/polyadenylase [Candidatus Terasakiella magnetica]|uniref:Polyribonucleotide nucleotidyltransferase n=1 Tax=Candidatus Terasakiella magnetica TaxID=1867952 RepID=A0A1C3REA1_9PROT|nr:polyribonucleotide nucleotidyltransferase [Candidatus Terasakiella magnetica]SCA55613.1 polynucleotide phosphorylase/polyadenylase [Candidatus Terasakiella magnetica]